MRRRKGEWRRQLTHGLRQECEEVVREMEVLQTDQGRDAERKEHELVLRHLQELEVPKRTNLLWKKVRLFFIQE